jgi:hypothetical protein
MLDIVNKSAFNWNFNEDDWFVDLIMSHPEIRHRIFILKNYSLSKINDIIYEIYSLVKEYRNKLELESQSFIDKKKYLTLAENSSKIQITLEDEYRLKDLIDKYKIFEFISWFHLGKNAKIFKHCTLQKQEILEKIYPIVDLSIRKVIGSKVIGPYTLEFEEAVNNAWLAIIKYLPKIDTSKVMFSIFVGIGHRSAIYYNATNLKEKYNVVRINDLEIINDKQEGLGEELFVNTVVSNNPDNDYEITDVEDDILNEIDSIDIEQTFYLESVNDEIDDIVNSLENPEKTSCLQQNILAHSYNILSGKIKKMCFEKIFAEFFNDLINSKISEKVISKHTPILTSIMDIATIDPNIANDIESNTQIYKMFRDWLKEKIDSKLYKYNIRLDDKTDVLKKQQALEIVKREDLMIKYIKEHKTEILPKLLEFKSACINLRF